MHALYCELYTRTQMAMKCETRYYPVGSIIADSKEVKIQNP